MIFSRGIMSPMRKKVKKYLVPNKDNEHIPHILGGRSACSLAVITVLLAGWAFFQPVFLRQTDFTAAIVERVLVELANRSRTEDALPSLVISPLLEEAARRKAHDMAEKGYFSHVSPEGITPWQWLTEAGYRYAYAGENLAVDFADSETVNDAWLRSPAHRANILNTRFTEIGIAVAHGMYQGRDTIFVVQMFGSPRAASVENAPPSKQKGKKQAAGVSVASVVEKPEVVYQDEMFVVARDRDVSDLSVHISENFLVPSAQAAAEVSLIEKVFSGPKKVLVGLYLMLGSLVLFSFVLTLLVPLRKKTSKHFLHLSYGVALFILILTGLSMSIFYLSGVHII